MEVLGWLLIGGAAGWIAGVLVQGDDFGPVADIVFGVCGGLVGGFLLQQFGIEMRGLIGSIATAVIGAIALVSVLKMARIA